MTRVVRRRLTTVPRLREVVESRPRVRWREQLAMLMDDVGLGAQSPLEVEDLRNDRRHGLPLGGRQAPRTIGGGREWLDVRVDLPGMRQAAVKELDGRLGHDPTTDRWRDMRRDTRSAVRGEVTARFGWADLIGRACEAAALWGMVLEAQGWTGSVQACGSGCSAPQTRMALMRELEQQRATRQAPASP